MKFYLIAGEASGDLHGSNLMRGLFAEDPAAQMRYWGGPLMDAVCRSATGESGLVHDYSEGAVMGFFELLPKLRRILGNLRSCKEDILAWKPDVVILIDYPGFNFRIAEFAHRHGIKVFYYIAPKVWASRERRVKKLKAYVDRLFIVFPFEKEYFDRKGVSYIYKGNPLIDAVDGAALEPRASLLSSLGWQDGPYVALLAGSRASEVSSMMKVLVEFADRLRSVPGYEGYRFIVAGAPRRSEADYAPYIGGRDYIRVVFDKTYSILSGAEAAVINSGTASLEAVLLGTPQVVGYVSSPLTFPLILAVVRVRHISLGNLIVGRSVFRELIQDNYTPENVLAEVRHILEDKGYRERMLAGYEEIRTLLGGKGASAATARAMIENL
jgi:lipid-A-disaccharide synthase